MAWIELHQSVWTHAKTYALADELHIDETYAAAHLARLWSWALDNAPDGDLSGLRSRAIAAGAGWKKSADEFVRALTVSGWIDEPCTLHDWHDYAGRLVDKRRANVQRMRDARAANAARTVQNCAGATVPNSTVPYPTEPLSGQDDLPTPVREMRDHIISKLPLKFAYDPELIDEARLFAVDYAGKWAELINAYEQVKRQPDGKTIGFPGSLRKFMPPLAGATGPKPEEPKYLPQWQPMDGPHPDRRPEPGQVKP